MALLKSKAKSAVRVFFRRDWHASERTRIPAGAIMDLPPDLLDEAPIREQLANGTIERVPPDRAVPIGQQIPEIGRADYERWFYVPPPPVPEAILSSDEIARKFGWRNFDVDRVERFSFPRPVSHLMRRQRFGWAYERIAQFRESDIKQWAADIRALAESIKS
jgi:hypothetical protein